MRKLTLLLVIIGLFIAGCVAFPSTRTRPLEERSIGGEGADKILLVEISGLITDREKGDLLGLKKEPRLTARIREELDKAASDKRVKALILRINTPGGLVTTSDIIRHELIGFKEEKGVPVVAQFMGVAASGGYYIATAADKLIAHPTTVTGSIGVVAFKLNAAGLLEKIGVRDETIKSGEMKDMGSPFRAMTEKDRRVLQGVIGSLFERFKALVIEARPAIREADLPEVFDGRVFAAQRALELGLVDRIGYMDDAIDLAKELAGIEKARVVTYTRPTSYTSNVYSRSANVVPTSINLLNIEGEGVARLFGLSIMYLWLP